MRTSSQLVSAYAQQFARSPVGGQPVASPLGVWLLLALAAPVTGGDGRRELERILGTTVHDAAARAGALLANPHPAVAAAVAVWNRELAPAFTGWAATLPAEVQRGPVPDQVAADAWAAANTDGLITEFPLQIDELTRLVLASALATDISWQEPLTIGEPLGGQFGARRGLVFDDGIQLIAETEAAGLVAVAAPPTSSALSVLSVIGASEVPTKDVQVAAHQVAALLAGQGDAARRVPPAELEDGHAWTVTDRLEKSGCGEPVEWLSHVPAFSDSADFDISATPGLGPVLDALAAMAKPEDQPAQLEAKQSAVAEYTRTGFKAAAVTAIGLVAGCVPIFEEQTVRRIELRFNRPHAVLACATTDEGPQEWRGMPVFTAWVTDPQEPDNS